MKKLLLHNRSVFSTFIFGLIWLCLVLTHAHATTYYVAINGNDNNSGTRELPFLTIGKGASIAKEGDVVIIKSGTYKPITRIQPANSGTSNAPITFMAEVKDEAIIDGSLATSPSSTDRLGLFSVLGTTTVTQNWIVVDGLRIINSNFVGFYARYASNITFKNCSTLNTGASGFIGANANDIKVLNCKVQRACQFPSASLGTNECITMASVNRFKVAYCTVSDRLVDVNNGGEGIDAKNECKDGSIHHNIVFDLVRLGIYVDGFSRNLSNVEVYANKVYKCTAGIGLAIEAGGTLTGVKIHDNVVYDIPRVGIRVSGYLVNGVMKDVFVYQNTVVRCGTQVGLTYENCGILVDADDPGNANFVVRNNIVADCPIQIKTKTFAFLTVDNNLLFGFSSSPKPTNPTAVYANAGTNAILENPLFENLANADFKLKADSPAIDKAVGTPLSTVDFYDFIRTGKGDIGAVEFQKAVVVLSTENSQEENKEMIIYPNPANREINLNFNAHSGMLWDVEIIDFQGNSLQKTKFISAKTGQNEVRLSTELLRNGTYILQINNQKGDRIFKKVVIQK